MLIGIGVRNRTVTFEEENDYDYDLMKKRGNFMQAASLNLYYTEPDVTPLRLFILS